MKRITIFILLMGFCLLLVPSLSFAQDVATDTVPAVDSVEMATFIRITADGQRDTFQVPVGGSIIDLIPTTKDAFAKAGDTLVSLLWGAVAMFLVFLSQWVPGLKNFNLPNQKRIKVLGATVVIFLGFLVKFQDGGSWLSWATQHYDIPVIATGLFSWLFKPLLGLFNKNSE